MDDFKWRLKNWDVLIINFIQPRYIIVKDKICAFPMSETQVLFNFFYMSIWEICWVHGQCWTAKHVWTVIGSHPLLHRPYKYIFSTLILLLIKLCCTAKAPLQHRHTKCFDLLGTFNCHTLLHHEQTPWKNFGSPWLRTVNWFEICRGHDHGKQELFNLVLKLTLITSKRNYKPLNPVMHAEKF